MSIHPLAEHALVAYLTGLTAVDGTRRVRDRVRTGALDDWFEDREHPKRIQVLGLGKAAPSMLWGLVEANVPFQGIGVSPRQRTRPTVDTFEWLTGDHPVPGDASFEAGQRLLEWADTFPEGAPLLVLLSGGTSSVAEATPDDDRTALTRAWRQELAAGVPIEDLNAVRASRSLLKGGRLGRRLLERTDRIRVWVLGDTPPGTEPETVGSAPFFQQDDPDRIPHTVVATAEHLADGAAQALGQAGFSVYKHTHRLEGPVDAEVDRFLEALDGLAPDRDVALVAAGEPTIALPEDAPAGGRCQHAALLAGRWLDGRRSAGVFFAAGSDGRDGTTREAGAWADCDTWGPEGEAALEYFEAHPYLDAMGRTVRTGPSRTNVNDLWIGIRPAEVRDVGVEADARGPLVIK